MYYNDIKAGDGIYTSVELFSKEVNDEDEYIYVGKHFEYLDDFDLLLIKNYGHFLNEIIEINNSYNQSAKTKGVVASIKIACKIVTRECPEDKWYNKCLFSSPCTCVYLEDCELTIDVGI